MIDRNPENCLKKSVGRLYTIVCTVCLLLELDVVNMSLFSGNFREFKYIFVNKISYIKHDGYNYYA